MPAVGVAPIVLEHLPHVPWEIETWRLRKPARRVGRINNAIALVDGGTVRLFPSLTAACASVAL